MPRGKTELTND
jgi:hypothetical protein